MNTRKDNNGKALKAWIRIAPGHIAKALRHIGSRTNGRDIKGNIVFSPTYIDALIASNRGDGTVVQRIARSLK